MSFENFMWHMQEDIHRNAIEKGWWEKVEVDAEDLDGNKVRVMVERSFGDVVCLFHAEISEAVEAFRKHNPPDEHCPGYSNIDIELADTVIRIMDFCGANNINLGAAIEAKHEFNKTRSYKHGGKAI